MPRRELKPSPDGDPAPKQEPAVNRQPGKHPNSAAFSFCMGACVVYYIWIANLAPGDFQGDSWEYLTLASHIKAVGFQLAAYRYLRGVAYPWLLSITWGHTGLGTYLFQGALFLVSFYLALRMLAWGSVYCVLPLCVALIPAFAFLQKLAYPDGVLVSLTLLFFVALARRRWGICAVLGLLLTLTKLVFAVVLPVALIVFLFQRGTVNLKMLARGVVLALALAPVGEYLLLNYVLVDLGYMVAFVRPYARGYTLDSVFPGGELNFSCGGSQHAIPRNALFFEPITVPYNVADFGPLQEAEAKRMGCTTDDLQSLKRRLTREAFLAHPLRHLTLGLRAFSLTVAGLRDVPHVSGILHSREQSWLAHYDERSYFDPYELMLRGEYAKWGIEMVQGRPLLFFLNDLCTSGGQAILSLAGFGILAICAGAGYRRGRLLDCVRDPVNLGLFLFLLIYSGAVAGSVPLIYDRYSFVNLMILSILAARVATMTLGSARSASSDR
jgi:hypothetical protein